MTVTLQRTRASKSKPRALDPLVVAIWGPHGSPGRSTVALNLAYELSLSKRTLLVDLDLVSPSQSMLLGLGETQPGITAVARLIRQGRLNAEELQRLSIHIKHKSAKLRFLPGLSAPNRWNEVTEETVSQLLQIAKIDFEFIVLDLSASLEDRLVSPESPTTRNGATRAALEHASQVVTVVKNSKVSLQNYVNQFMDLQSLNKNRILVINMSANDKLQAAIKQLTKESVSFKIPCDDASVNLAESEGLPLAISRRKSPARTAILNLANRLLEC